MKGFKWASLCFACLQAFEFSLNLSLNITLFFVVIIIFIIVFLKSLRGLKALNLRSQSLIQLGNGIHHCKLTNLGKDIYSLMETFALPANVTGHKNTPITTLDIGFSRRLFPFPFAPFLLAMLINIPRKSGGSYLRPLLALTISRMYRPSCASQTDQNCLAYFVYRP